MPLWTRIRDGLARTRDAIGGQIGAALGLPLARALVKGGLPVLEITLRTAKAMDCIRAIIAEVEGAIVGSGTVLTPQQLRDCDRLGCKFAVSPGSTGRLLGAGEDYDIALLPGGVTASECMALLEWGYTIQKFFPAEPAGGTAADTGERALKRRSYTTACFSRRARGRNQPPGQQSQGS